MTRAHQGTGTLGFTVSPSDSTGMPILDGSDISYSGRLVHPTTSQGRRLQSGGSTVCSVLYDSTAGGHTGSCDMPMSGDEHIAGTFTLEVTDEAGDLVGGVGAAFAVASCPINYFFHSASGKCAACPRGADCMGA